MKSVLLLSLSATVLACAAAPAVSSEPDIGGTFLLAGDYHEGEAPVHPGAGWLALAPVGKRWELLPAKVRSTRFEDTISDEPGQRTGVRIASSRKNALALLRLPYLTPGPLEVTDNETGESGPLIEAGSPVDIRFKGLDFRIETKNKRVFLVKGAQRTPLKELRVEPGIEASVSLQWAGDLDRDGELDLLMGYSGNNSSGSCLFLSAQKAKGFLLKHIACHGGIGC
ncbi:hypothetical protein [Massilia genomosp. 1]|uniref:VCBS repeat-containing protein n=1 Tax=Massilia genomosp. 1 TaxID=2609280 RepID=A0ABX0MDW1_9BURK|nr:hypothetical protein [Massilia genomosp. 1]NHZ60953.1 hypothetical protein [Massilia genomosp. 1]